MPELSEVVFGCHKQNILECFQSAGFEVFCWYMFKSVLITNFGMFKLIFGSLVFSWVS